ncbi:MAG: septal ring lytic transglycosylase RlpA family protein [Bacteroidota bacterium]|nr:septal ring lytic transglycosylase RlpA family protein [Bacteroidota bacterium]MDP4211679.1 septal ring lytic transglycosylase RlpA family protein [Bacteroidota bacterium]
MKRIVFLMGLFAMAFQVRAQEKSHGPPHARKHSGKKSSAKLVKKYPTQYGTASYYANKFEGRKTACGEIFHQDKLSGASNIIPMNNWVRVTNLRNKKSVILRINDRMHPRNPRLIDLSRAAAHRLSYTGRGIVRVKVEVLGRHLSKGIEKG